MLTCSCYWACITQTVICPGLCYKVCPQQAPPSVCIWRYPVVMWGEHPRMDVISMACNAVGNIGDVCCWEMAHGVNNIHKVIQVLLRPEI